MTAAELIAARKALRLSQAALAARLGISRVTVARWETNARPIPPYLDLAMKQLAQEQPK